VLSRIVSPTTTDGEGSTSVEMDAGPFGADMSMHATPATTATATND
jgi:hypothetical protein